MPWKETDVQSERIRFVVEVEQGLRPFSQSCRRYGISRKTGYKWLYRYREAGSLSGVLERSRRPLRSPGRTELEIEERGVQLRQRYGWGGRKLAHLLGEEGIELGHATVDRIVRRRGLVLAGDRQSPAVERFERSAPNELIQMDFKGQFPLACGAECFPLSLLDDHSRYAQRLTALPSTATEGVRSVLRSSF